MITAMYMSGNSPAKLAIMKENITIPGWFSSASCNKMQERKNRACRSKNKALRVVWCSSLSLKGCTITNKMTKTTCITEANRKNMRSGIIIAVVKMMNRFRKNRDENHR